MSRWARNWTPRRYCFSYRTPWRFECADDHGALGAIEAALRSCGIPIGSGGLEASKYPERIEELDAFTSSDDHHRAVAD